MSADARVNRCPRCDGLLHYEALSPGYLDRLFRLPTWRCLNCGNLIELQILKNRQAAPPRALPPKLRFPLAVSC